MADEPTVRDALNDAFDKAEAAASQGGGGAPTPASPATPAAPAAAPSGGAAPASPSGAQPAPSAPAPRPAVTAPPGTVSTTARTGAAAVATPGVAAGATPIGGEPPLRAPAAWRPEIREEWGKLPPTIQAEIHRREKELTRQLSESAEARRQHEAMAKVTAPYQHLMAMDGMDTTKSFGEYLRTAQILRMGTPQEKAQTVAAITRQFGVDIRALDAALAGVTMPPGQQQPGQPLQDPRLDQLLSRIEAAQQAQHQQLTAAAASSVEEFMNDASHEFIEDVREDMADLLEVAAGRGRRMSMQDAYDRACAMHPEISKVIAQRAAAQNAAPTGAALSAKQRAASSHPGGAGGPGNANGTKAPSVREALEAAYNQHTQA